MRVKDLGGSQEPWPFEQTYLIDSILPVNVQSGHGMAVYSLSDLWQQPSHV